MYILHVCLSSSFCGSFTARLQLSDITNELAECQGKCWTLVQRNPRAKERGTTQYLLWQWQIQTSGTAFTGFDMAPSSQICQTPLELLLSIILRSGTQDSLEQLLHGFEVMCFTLTVKIKGPGWGWGGKNNSSGVSRELAVNLKVSSEVFCQYKTSIWFK